MTTTVTARCMCGAFNLEINLATSSLPISRTLCLCARCRSVSGSCGTSYLAVPKTQVVDPSKYNLTSYDSSEWARRHFCATCGAHCLSVAKGFGTFVATGLLDKSEGILTWNGCKWVSDTVDGGISIWLKEIEDTEGTKRQLKRWMLADGADKELVSDNSLTSAPAQPQSNGDKLEGQCHCGGVKFYITRPNEASKQAQSGFPDLMAAWHSNPHENPSNETWWLRSNDTKYVAGTCTCTSCRLTSGFEIAPWAFVPEYNIFQEDGSPIDYKMGIGTLRTYASSPGILREFCSVCGATVLFYCERRPDIIDVSPGVLDPKLGARVESWLEWWTGRVSFEELAVNRTLVRSLEDGLKSQQISRDV